MRYIIRIAIVLTIVWTVSYATKAQCVPNPTGETAIGLRNASNHFLTFYIDGYSKGGVPAGDRSIDFVVPPGQHLLLAEARVGQETISASRTVTIAKGDVCTWLVTDPPKVTFNFGPGRFTQKEVTQ